MNKVEEIKLWKECIFVFDSSALLNLYEYSEGTRKNIFDTTFNKLKKRLWMPNHVQQEFLNNREVTLKKPIRYYSELKDQHLKSIESHFEQLRNKTKTNSKHPHLSSEPIKLFGKQFEYFKKVIIDEMNEKVIEIEQMSSNDTVLKNLNSYFEIGKPYDYFKITDIAREGEFRYKYGIPPGYKDENDKKGFQIFGDLIIWKQVLDYSKEMNKSIILITDDCKEDWWVLDGRNRIEKPREELINEIKSFSNVDFWMYDSPGFLEKSKEMLETKIKEHTITEVRNKSHEWYGFTAEHAFTNWAQKEYGKFGEVFSPRSSIDSVDLVFLDEERKKIGFITKYIGLKNLSTAEVEIKKILNSISKTPNKYYDNIVIAIMATDRKTAMSVTNIFKSIKDQIKLFYDDKYDPEYIVGYLDGYDFVKFDGSI